MSDTPTSGWKLRRVPEGEWANQAVAAGKGHEPLAAIVFGNVDCQDGIDAFADAVIYDLG